MNEEIESIKIFTCKRILYHAFIHVMYQNTAFYADNVEYQMCKPDRMIVIHGLTKKHAERRAIKYLRKRKLIK